VKRKIDDKPCEAPEPRERIMGAAFDAFMEHGFAGASTLDIATRAKVSKRELYSHFRSKEDLFAAGISARTKEMRFPLALPDATSLAGLAATLEALGIALLSGVTDDDVVAVYRLAISESSRSPNIAKTLDEKGRGAVRRGLGAFIKASRKRGLVVVGDPAEMTYLFCSLLLSDFQLRLVLGVARRPGPKEIAERARRVTDLFMKLYANRPSDEMRESTASER